MTLTVKDRQRVIQHRFIPGGSPDGVAVASQVGVSTSHAVTGLMMGVIGGVKEIGGDVGEMAVSAVTGAIGAAREIGEIRENWQRMQLWGL